MFASSGLLDRSFLMRFLKNHVHFSFRELSILSSVFDKMKAWNGRIYCKVLYGLAGGKEAWLALKKKLYGFLVIMDEWQMKKCRQWGWSQKVLDRVSSMQHASKTAAVLLAGVEETDGKKRVLVGATLQAMNPMHNRSSDQPNQHVLTPSREKGCQSKEFREE